MKVHVNVEEDDSLVRTIEYDLVLSEPIEALATKVASDLGESVEDILADFAANGATPDRHAPAIEFLHGCVTLSRVCIDLHFETESVTHRFSSKTKWARVHQFGCDRFHVAHDACANLELHEGEPKGPPLNEKQEIGSFKDCKTVWLVKPGPEPSGCR